jgi:hypothetical protein
MLVQHLFALDGCAMATLNSGGAKGADVFFGKCAKAVGHTVRHFVFEGFMSIPKESEKDYVVLTQDQLNEAIPFVHKANETLRRRFPTNADYTNNLLCRNYWQIKDSNAMYAVAPLDWIGKVQGGTAWAVQMAIDRYMNMIYLYDLNTRTWMQYIHSMRQFDYILPIDMIKPIHIDKSVYTGIGTRDLSGAGRKAIEELYQND